MRGDIQEIGPCSWQTKMEKYFIRVVSRALQRSCSFITSRQTSSRYSSEAVSIGNTFAITGRDGRVICLGYTLSHES